MGREQSYHVSYGNVDVSPMMVCSLMAGREVNIRERVKTKVPGQSCLERKKEEKEELYFSQ